MIEEILEAYDWFDHPDGPKFVETHRDEYRTSGHWLFLPGTVSSFHKVLNNDELWLVHVGRLVVHVIDPTDGRRSLYCLGQDLAAGEQPVANVPLGHWQAAELPDGTPFAFGSNVCAPPFSFEAFAIGNRTELLQDFPAHRELITRLCKEA